MNRWLNFCGMLAAVCVLGSCAGVPSADDSGTRVVLKDADGGKSIRVRMTDRVSVELVSNPTTGFLWNITGIDETMVQLDGQETYVPDPAPKGIVGSGGRTIFPLRLIQPGRTEIVFEYRRPFEQKPDPEKRIVFQLEIVSDR